MRTQCNDFDKEWEHRITTFTEEINAVSEAISILTEDDTYEMLAKSITLLQKASSSSMLQSTRRACAADDPTLWWVLVLVSQR